MKELFACGFSIAFLGKYENALEINENALEIYENALKIIKNRCQKINPKKGTHSA